MTQVRIFAELEHDFELPAYETLNASGMDVRANERVVIVPGQTTVVKTGLFVEIPEGFEIQVRPRSGMSLKTGIRIANAPGTIDADYRGEIGIICHNTSTHEFVVELGDRIAQLVLQQVPKIEWVRVNAKEELSNTERGVGGYGSTGRSFIGITKEN